MKLTIGKVPIRIRSFDAGQHSSIEATNTEPDQATLLQDCILKDKGQCEQREGSARIGDNPDTLISHWTFDASTSEDDKGSNDGTYSAVSFVVGKFGICASFNGTTSVITVPAASNISASTMGAFRLSAWVYVDSDGENDEGRILDNYTTAVGYRLYVFGESAGTVKVKFEVGYGTTNALVVTSTTFTTSAWHKIDAIHNADRSLDVYLDGVLASYSTDTTGVGTIGTDTSNTLYIGNNSAGTRTFDGEIDDVRIYDGAFTATDCELFPTRGLARFKVGDTYDKLVRIKGTSLQSLDSDYKGWTTIDSGFTSDKDTEIIQAKDEIYILNGYDNVHTMTSGEAVTDEGNTNTDPPLGTTAEWTSNNRLFISGHLTDSLRDYVWFSSTLDGKTFDRNVNYFRVKSGNQARVVKIKEFREFELIIYKTDSIHVLNMDGATPLTDWDLKAFSTSVGCPAKRTVMDVGNDQIFLSNEGNVRLLSRTQFDKLHTGVISEPIEDVLEEMNTDAIANCCAWFVNGKYVLGFPAGTNTVPNRFCIWDSHAAQRKGTPTAGWTVVATDAWKVGCFSEYDFGDGIKTLVGGCSDALSIVYKILSGNTDNGAQIYQTIRTADHDFTDRVLDKIFDPLQMVAQTGSDATYSISAEIDRGGFTQIGTMSLTGALVTPFTTPATTGSGTRKVSTFRTKHLGRGKTIRYEIKNLTYNKKPTFVEYTGYARPLEGRVS